MIDQRFGRNMRRIMNEMALPMSDFANLIGVKTNTLSGWLNFRSYPRSLKVIYNVHRITGRTFDEILG